jgi:hypothetical protein
LQRVAAMGTGQRDDLAAGAELVAAHGPSPQIPEPEAPAQEPRSPALSSLTASVAPRPRPHLLHGGEDNEPRASPLRLVGARTRRVSSASSRA